MKIDSNEVENYDFSWWPDVVGYCMVAAMMAFLFTMADGML
jgi:hypothetical protein